MKVEINSKRNNKVYKHMENEQQIVNKQWVIEEIKGKFKNF